NNAAAKKYYERVISLDANNFEGNLELGLLYLKEYIADPNNVDVQNKAQEYLLKANQIQPSEVNTLKSLAVLYEQSGNVVQQERVNNILNQLTINWNHESEIDFNRYAGACIIGCLRPKQQFKKGKRQLQQIQ